MSNFLSQEDSKKNAVNIKTIDFIGPVLALLETQKNCFYD